MEKRDAKEYIESFFEELDKSNVQGLQSTDNIYSRSGEVISNHLQLQIAVDYQTLSIFIIKKDKKVKELDKKKGVLTIERQHLLNVDFIEGYFYGALNQPRFLYEKDKGSWYPVQFVFKNNTIENFDARSLNHEEGVEFKGNHITGTILRLRSGSEEKHDIFLKENKIVGGEVEFLDCYFEDQDIEGMTVRKLFSVSASERLSFKDCKILETDFRFESKCPIVQFLGKTQIDKIKHVYRINFDGYLGEDNGVRDIYFSEQFDLDKDGKNHTPEEKQYFFKQIRLFQDKRGDRVQALFAYKKYLEQELKHDRLQWRDKCIIYGSRLFGGGLDFVRPLLILLISFSIFSALIQPPDISFLFPVFPHIMFEKIANTKTLFDSFPYHLNLLRYPFSLLYYILLILSWYFIIKSLHKFTYKK